MRRDGVNTAAAKPVKAGCNPRYREKKYPPNRIAHDLSRGPFSQPRHINIPFLPVPSLSLRIQVKLGYNIGDKKKDRKAR